MPWLPCLCVVNAADWTYNGPNCTEVVLTGMVRTRFLKVATVFLVTLAGGLYVSHLGAVATEEKFRRSLLVTVEAEARTLERQLATSLASAQVLAMEVRSHGGGLNDFERYARDLLATFPGITNLQLAPSGIVASIYPRAGQEKVIGHNILKDDKRRDEAIRAIQTREITLAGPYELVQGGFGMVGRAPVFLQRDGVESFWGFTSVLIMLDDLIRLTNLPQLERSGYSYEIYRSTGNGANWELFHRSPLALAAFNQSVEMAVPNARWKLVIGSPAGSLPSGNGLGVWLSLGVALLLAALTNHILRQPERLQQMVNDKTRDLEVLAYHDPLTDLANRRLLMDRLEQTLQAVRAGQLQTAALLYIDLDEFKRVNDTKGHSVGDGLLKRKAHRLLQVLQPTDLLARMGGDEFAVLITNPPSRDAVVQVVERCLSVLGEIESIDGFSLTAAASIGIAMVPDDGQDPGTLLQHVDLAMYAAKSTSAHHAFFSLRQQTQVVERMQMADELARAVAQEEFFAHWQPIVRLTDGSWHSFEALLRWRHPTKGLLPPGQFIQLAEETGHIVPMGYLVLRQCCQAIRHLERQGQTMPRVAVNLSPLQFREQCLVENIRSILEDTGVSPSAVKIEVTESMLIDNAEGSIRLLQALRDMGIHIALDDFGTGYSSLSLLKRLPVDELKIDRSFIMEMVMNPDDQAIVKHLIDMAHTLGIQVVAEGVETAEQAHLLASYGCDFAQGYHFAEPRTPAAFFPRLSDVAPTV